jgi:hypothetical protein
MKNTAQVVGRLTEVIRAHNREVRFEALLKASLGVIFSLVTFGFVFWVGWVAGFFFANYIGLDAAQFALFLTLMFLIVATWSAWRRVDPLAGLEPLSEQQLFLMVAAPAITGGVYFSPRHATAGAALVMIGGPAAVFQALGVWTHRIRADEELIQDATRLLAACKRNCPANQVRKLAAALLLRQLALIKTIPGDGSPALTVTAKGSALLAKA